MASIDPQLRSLLATSSLQRERGATDAADPGGTVLPERVGLLVKFTGDVADLRAAGLETGTLIPNPAKGFAIVTGTLPLARLDDLASVSHVIKIELGRPLLRELDTSVAEIGARPLHRQNPAITGRGVTLAVVDAGVDYQHQAFRKADGSSRVLFLWDQTLTAGAGEASPPEYAGVGVEYDKNHIKTALANANPLTVVRTTEEPTTELHGTHVMGIAAGDGSQAGNCSGSDTYVGVAPEADLIFVKIGGLGQRIGESQRLVDAIAWILLRARKDDPLTPCVINVSLGDNLGPHDGTSLVEQAIDALLQVGTGVAIVKSAGNEGDSKRHALGTVTTAAPLDIDFDVRANDRGVRLIECWYPGAARLDLTLLAPGVPRPTSPVAAAAGATVNWTVNPAAPVLQRVSVVITQTMNDPDNNDNQVFIRMTPPPAGNLPSGRWTLRFTNTGAADADVHCWINRGNNTPFFASHVQRSHTISIPGTAVRVITVGSYADERFSAPDGTVTESGNLDATSSRGPTRSGARKPDMAAPGVNILAAKGTANGGCCCDCCYDFYHALSGTSMAAPHVAGVVALLLQVKRDMTTQEIHDALTNTARAPDPAFGAVPDDNWGFGKVDAGAAVAVVLAAQPAPPAGGGGGGGGAPIPGDFFLRPPLAGLQPSTLARRMQHFQTWLLARPGGHAAAALVSRHFDEVLQLINTHKRVATVWHRNGGPAFVRAALAISQAPDTVALPLEVNGIDATACLCRILERVRRHASPALVADIDAQRGAILALPGRLLRDVLDSPRRAA